jgi:hypothetical protein
MPASIWPPERWRNIGIQQRVETYKAKNPLDGGFCLAAISKRIADLNWLRGQDLNL